MAQSWNTSPTLTQMNTRQLAQMVANQQAPCPTISIRPAMGNLLQMLAMRLRLPAGNCTPFDDLYASLSGDKVFVFVVKNGEATVLEDGEDLFPSDNLITRLRMLQG